jgi:CheY-like chemotaxis protein
MPFQAPANLTPAAPPISMATHHPFRILLAEDNTVNQQVGLLMPSRLGYTADLAGDGQQTLQAVNQADYDLILMDIQMPNLNGTDAARLIRKNRAQNVLLFLP